MFIMIAGYDNTLHLSYPVIPEDFANFINVSSMVYCTEGTRDQRTGDCNGPLREQLCCSRMCWLNIGEEGIKPSQMPAKVNNM